MHTCNPAPFAQLHKKRYNARGSPLKKNTRLEERMPRKKGECRVVWSFRKEIDATLQAVRVSLLDQGCGFFLHCGGFVPFFILIFIFFHICSWKKKAIRELAASPIDRRPYRPIAARAAPRVRFRSVHRPAAGTPRLRSCCAYSHARNRASRGSARTRSRQRWPPPRPRCAASDDTST